ncbi:hypothetical protein O6H91_08G100500 [Diphasiastrum complanatum]|uniref:Uncharacterized protein n=1 Tax=Diphasiastrum complanatum TaxID=34168 RepID=A0ACC2D0K2_DIPCM|nr:hypothetical protein O6H91_08G100500 [Diphasiastrum complanatum]
MFIYIIGEASEMSGTIAPLPQKNSSCVYIPLLMITLLIVQLYFSSDPPFRLSQQAVDPSNVDGLHPASLSPEAYRKFPESGTCNISKGEWVIDLKGPLYTNASCAFIQEHQNCLKNGRPDLGYMNWRWKPVECDLPPFDGRLFLNMMTHKTMAFAGDSIARNHMQSLICALSQIESPQNLYRDAEDKFLTWNFPSYNFTLAILWSPYLVKKTEDAYKNVPEGVTKLFLDVVDDAWVSSLPQYDYVVLSSGQWYFKPGVYIIGGEIVGCHYCPGMNISQVGFFFAYEAALHSVYKNIISTPQYKGTTILRTISPDHFENGTWSTGGTCLRTVPFMNHSMDGINALMRDSQLKVLNNVSANEPAHAPKLKLLDITYSALMRPDGHPGPYRYPFPFSNGKSGHVQNDCLHWCLPGPIDTWNEMLLWILK